MSLRACLPFQDPVHNLLWTRCHPRIQRTKEESLKVSAPDLCAMRRCQPLPPADVSDGYLQLHARVLLCTGKADGQNQGFCSSGLGCVSTLGGALLHSLHVSTPPPFGSVSEPTCAYFIHSEAQYSLKSIYSHLLSEIKIQIISSASGF